MKVVPDSDLLVSFSYINGVYTIINHPFPPMGDPSDMTCRLDAGKVYTRIRHCQVCWNSGNFGSWTYYYMGYIWYMYVYLYIYARIYIYTYVDICILSGIYLIYIYICEMMGSQNHLRFGAPEFQQVKSMVSTRWEPPLPPPINISCALGCNLNNVFKMGLQIVLIIIPTMYSMYQML